MGLFDDIEPSGSSLFSDIEDAKPPKSSFLGIEAEKLPPGLSVVDTAKRIGSKVANELSFIPEFGKQIVGSAGDAAKMVNQIGEWYAPKDSAPEEFFRQGKEYWEERAMPEADVAGRSLPSEIALKGARALVPSGLAMAATIANPVLGGSAVFAGFGGSQAQETYDKLRKSGADDESATRAALINLVIEGGGETLADVVGGKLILKPIGDALGRVAKEKGVAAAAELAKNPAWVKNFAKNFAANAAVQSATEYGQGAGEVAVENEFGKSLPAYQPQSPHQVGVEGFKSGLGLSAILGIPSAVSAKSRSDARKDAVTTLKDTTASPEKHSEAINAVASEMLNGGVPQAEVETWATEQKKNYLIDSIRRIGTNQPAPDPTELQQANAAVGATVPGFESAQGAFDTMATQPSLSEQNDAKIREIMMQDEEQQAIEARPLRERSDMALAHFVSAAELRARRDGGISVEDARLVARAKYELEQREQTPVVAQALAVAETVAPFFSRRGPIEDLTKRAANKLKRGKPLTLEEEAALAVKEGSTPATEPIATDLAPTATPATEPIATDPRALTPPILDYATLVSGMEPAARAQALALLSPEQRTAVETAMRATDPTVDAGLAQEPASRQVTPDLTNTLTQDRERRSGLVAAADDANTEITNSGGVRYTTNRSTDGTQAPQAQQGQPQASLEELFGAGTLDRDTGIVPLAGERIGVGSRVAIRALSRLFGTKVKFYFKPDAADGSFTRDGDTLYINTASGATLLNVAGHEHGHRMRTKMPIQWAAIKDAYLASLPNRDAAFKKFAANYWGRPEYQAQLAAVTKLGFDAPITDALTRNLIGMGKEHATIGDFITEELVSDLNGKHWGSKAFWKATFDALADKYSPKVAKAKVKALADATIEMIDKLIQAGRVARQAEFSTVDQDQLEKTRKVVAKAHADWIAENRGKTSSLKEEAEQMRENLAQRQAPASTGQAADLEDLERQAFPDVEVRNTLPRTPAEQTENREGVIVGARPGEFDWSFAKGGTPPPIQHPVQLSPRVEKLGPAMEKILNSKGVRQLIEDVFGVTNLKVYPTLGQFKGQPEPSFAIYGDGLTFEAADGISRMLGFSFAQESTIVTQPVYAGDEDTWPAFYVSNGKKLSKKEIEAGRKFASETGLDYSTSIDGTAFKFFFDGSDFDQYHDRVVAFAKAAGLKQIKQVGTRSTFNESANYTQALPGEQGADGSGGRQVWLDDSGTGRSSLFGRTVDQLLIPYAKAVGAEGYRVSPDLFADRFGLSPQQREYIREALRPKSGLARSTAKITSGEEKLEPTKSDLRAKQPRSNNTDIMWALQNRAAQTGLIEPGDYSDHAKKVISEAIADEVLFHISRPEGKSAIGWYDAALKRAKGIYDEVFPELKSDRDSEMLFDAILGITSQGNDVHSNSVFAGRIYYLVTRQGKTLSQAVDTLYGTFGGETRAIENNLLKLEQILDRNGYDRMREMMNKKMTVGEWNAILRRDESFYYDGKKLEVEGAARQTVNGWMVFGPKIGSFINNLHGDYSTLTADLWFSRTWNRILGFSFLHTPMQEAEKYQSFKEALIAEHTKTTEPKRIDKNGKPVYWEHGEDINYTDAELDSLMADPDAMLKLANELYDYYSKGFTFSHDKKDKKSGFSVKSDLRRRAKNWIEHRDESAALPRGPNERAFQQDSVEAAQKIIKRKLGETISIADIQAALWYHEKELFGMFGAGDSKAAPADYADAANNFMERFNDGDLFFVEKPSPRYILGSKGDYTGGSNDGQGTGSTRRSNARSSEYDRTSPAAEGRPSYGRGREGAVQATGVHYSKAQRGELSSRFFGTGMKGEEGPRISYAKDERIKNRLYFYISTGKGVTPESDVGAHAHTVDLQNLYDLDSDLLEIYPRSDPTQDARDQPTADQRMNSFESKVLDAGFDGYLTRNFGTGGAVVLLGDHSVPVQYEGSGVKPDAKAFDAPVTLRGWRELQDKVSNNRSLPTGSMMGEDWKRMMPKLMPEVDVSHLPDDKRFYKDQLVKRPEARMSNRRTPTYTEPRRLVDAALPGLAQQTVSIEGKEVGFVTLKTVDGQPKILAHIEIFDSERGQGYAEDVMADLLGKTDELWIYNIQPASVPFWQKMGVKLDEYEDWNYGNGTVDEGTYRDNAEERGQAGQEAGDERQAEQGDGRGGPEEGAVSRFSLSRAEMRDYLLGPVVTEVKRGTIAAKDGERASDAAYRWLNEHPQAPFERDDIGEIVFDRNGLENSLQHKFGWQKLNAVAAIPDVLHKGIVIDASSDTTGKPLLHTLLAAPINIDGERYQMVIRLRQDSRGTNPHRFYVHEVVLEKAVAAPIKTGAEPIEGLGRTGGRDHIHRILQDILNFKEARNSLPRFATPPTPAWSIHDEVTKTDAFMRNVQDNLWDLKKVQQAIGAIETKWDAYKHEILYHGKVAKGMQEYMRDEVQPLLKLLQAAKADAREFETFLWARHAPERNAQIAKINDDMPDGGSGLTNAQAADLMAGNNVTLQDGTVVKGIDQTKRALYSRLAPRIDAMTAKTRDMIREAGLEADETLDAWEAAYQNYVPLMRKDDEGPTGQGQGYTVRGGASKRAMGSFKGVQQIMGNLMKAREDAIVRGQKNGILQSLYGMVLKNPNPDFWAPIRVDSALFTKYDILGMQIDKAEAKLDELINVLGASVNDPAVMALDQELNSLNTQRSALVPQINKAKTRLQADLTALGIDPAMAQNIADLPIERYINAHGDVSYRPNNNLRNGKNVVTLRVNGGDRYIVFNEDSPRAMKMVEALKKLDGSELNEWLRYVAPITRWFASVNTQFNPIFGLWNLMRDSGAAALNLSTTALANRKFDVTKRVPAALAGIYGDTRKNRKGQVSQSHYGKLYEQFQEDGAKTGYRDMFATSEKRTAAALREVGVIDHSSKVMDTLDKIWHKTGGKKVIEDVVGGWLTDYNEAMENAWRLAAYEVAIDELTSQGMSMEDARKEAAVLAKNLTVNFNKKGIVGSSAGSLYAFFNAAVQGTTRMVETLQGPMGKKIIGGGMMLGAANALALMFAGFDDEEPPEFVRERHLIVPYGALLGNKQYMAIPYPLGFHVIPNTGRNLMEMMLGRKTPFNALADTMISMAEAFNPVGSSASLAQMLSPTAADPIVALGENKDWTGKKIAKERMSPSDQTPGFKMGKDTSTAVSKLLAEAINGITGGTSYVKGKMSPTPDQIDYLAGQVGGGVWRELSKLEQTTTSQFTGEELPQSKVPLVGKLFGNAGGSQGAQSKFYANIDKLERHEATIKGLTEDGKRIEAERYRLENKDARFVSRANAVQREVSYFRRKKREAVKVGDKAQVQKWEKRISDTMARFNEQVNAAQ